MKKVSTIGAFLVGCLLVLFLTMPSLIRLHELETGNAEPAKDSAPALPNTGTAASESAEIPIVPDGYKPIGAERITYNAADAEPLPDGKKLTIGILQFMEHPSLDDIRFGMIDQLAQRGYINGINIDIIYKNGQADQNTMKSIADQFIAQDLDILVGVATPAAQALQNAAAGQTPVIFAGISDPVGAGLVKSLENPGQPVTGATFEPQDAATLDLIKAIMPEAKTLGVLYNTSEQNAAQQVGNIKELAPAAGFEIKERTITSTNDLKQVAEQLAGEVDAIYVPQDNTIAGAMDTLIPATNAKGVPVFPAVDAMVSQGGLATMGLNQYMWGADSGTAIADVIEGADASTYPVIVSKISNQFINSDAATALGIEIPAEVAEAAIDMAPSKAN